MTLLPKPDVLLCAVGSQLQPVVSIPVSVAVGCPLALYTAETVCALLALERGIKPPDCHCEACDIAANGGLRSRMSLCPQCGDKRCERAKNHINPCSAPAPRAQTTESPSQ